NVLDEYRGLENAYMQQQTERIARQYKVIKPNATQQEIDEYVSNPNSQPVFQQALLRTGEARDVLGQVQRRHEDIKNIEQTIAELAALFQELDLQIDAQDPLIVQIEGNVDDTNVKIEKAQGELTQAKMSAIAARKKKWICA
ncbi:4311_t:CDS:1, partial [Acaulospora colombiana]